MIPVFRAASTPACLAEQPTATALLFALPDFSSFLFSVCKIRLLRNDVGVTESSKILKAMMIKLGMRFASS